MLFHMYIVICYIRIYFTCMCVCLYVYSIDGNREFIDTLIMDYEWMLSFTYFYSNNNYVMVR